MLPDRLQKLCKTQKLRPLPWPDRTRRPLLTLWPSDSLVCPPGSEIRCSNSMSKKECEQACMVIGPFGQRTALIFRQIGRCGQSGRKKHAQWLMLSCLGTIQTPHMIVAALIATAHLFNYPMDCSAWQIAKLNSTLLLIKTKLGLCKS